MTAERKQPSYIPIRFVDDESESAADDPAAADPQDSRVIELNETDVNNDEFSDFVDSPDANGRSEEPTTGGPDLAELVATRAELKRLQSELTEAKDAAARRQADLKTTASGSNATAAKLITASSATWPGSFYRWWIISPERWMLNAASRTASRKSFGIFFTGLN